MNTQTTKKPDVSDKVDVLVRHCGDCADWMQKRENGFGGYCFTDPSHDHKKHHKACSQFKAPNVSGEPEGASK